MLEVAHRNDIELEGACEGSLACSTCHVVIRDQSVYDKLPEPDDDENDMLDPRLRPDGDEPAGVPGDRGEGDRRHGSQSTEGDAQLRRRRVRAKAALGTGREWG